MTKRREEMINDVDKHYAKFISKYKTKDDVLANCFKIAMCTGFRDTLTDFIISDDERDEKELEQQLEILFKQDNMFNALMNAYWDIFNVNLDAFGTVNGYYGQEETIVTLISEMKR